MYRMIARMLNFFTLRSLAVTRRRKVFFICALILVVSLSIYDKRIIQWLEGFPYVAKGIEIMLFALTIYIVMSAIRMLIVSRYRKRIELNSEKNDNFTIGASTLVGTITAIATVIWIFSVFEIEFYTFLTSIALFSVALATIFKDSIKDFIEGLFILFTAHYRVGDYVQVGNHQRGRIIDITLSKMILKLEDGSLLHLSNQTVNSSSVINLSTSSVMRIIVSISVPQEVAFLAFSEKIEERLQSEFSSLFLPSQSSFTISSMSAESYTVQCNIATNAYSFTFERKVKNAVQLFAGELLQTSKKAKEKAETKKKKAEK